MKNQVIFPGCNLQGLSADCDPEWESKRGLPKPMPFTGYWKRSPLPICPSMPFFPRQITETTTLSVKQIWCGTNTALGMLRSGGKWPQCDKVAQGWWLLNWWEVELLWEVKPFKWESSFKGVTVTMSLFLIMMVALPLLGNCLVSSAQHLWFCYTNTFPAAQDLCPGEISRNEMCKALWRSRTIDAVLRS